MATYPGLTEFTLSVEVVKQGQERGSIIDGDPGGLAGVLRSMLHGVAILVIENQIRPYAEGPEGIEAVTRYSVQLLQEMPQSGIDKDKVPDWMREALERWEREDS